MKAMILILTFFLSQAYAGESSFKRIKVYYYTSKSVELMKSGFKLKLKDIDDITHPTLGRLSKDNIKKLYSKNIVNGEILVTPNLKIEDFLLENGEIINSFELFEAVFEGGGNSGGG